MPAPIDTMTQYEKNRSQILASLRAQREADPEKFRKRTRDFQKRNPEKAAAWAKRYKVRHREKWNAYVRAWRAKRAAAKAASNVSTQLALTLPSANAKP
jgi:hypothetical protein